MNGSLHPYSRSTRTTISDREAVTTLTTRDRLALLAPDEANAYAPSANDGDVENPEPRPVTENEIDNCRFRMFALEEIARAMSMERHVNGGEYVVRGNRRQRQAMYGNSVTPPVMMLLVSRILQVLDEPA